MTTSNKQRQQNREHIICPYIKNTELSSTIVKSEQEKGNLINFSSVALSYVVITNIIIELITF